MKPRRAIVKVVTDSASEVIIVLRVKKVCVLRHHALPYFVLSPANGANQARCKAPRELAGWGIDFMIIVCATS
jgi:hypothetical protein